MRGGNNEGMSGRMIGTAGLMAYIEAHMDEIYVRERVNGLVGNYSLAELPSRLAVLHIFRWLRENRVPARAIKETISEPVD